MFLFSFQVPVGGGAGRPDTAGQSQERGGQHAAAALPGLTPTWSRAPAVSHLGHAVASCRTPGSSKRAETRTRRTFSRADPGWRWRLYLRIYLFVKCQFQQRKRTSVSCGRGRRFEKALYYGGFEGARLRKWGRWARSASWTRASFLRESNPSPNALRFCPFPLSAILSPALTHIRRVTGSFQSLNLSDKF